jgi:Ser/Thr protein kinase RdoA (MazF antagonist)
MKPYDELTRLGRLRRLRPLAHVALEAYGLAEARLQLVRDAGNTLYRVHAARPVPGEEPDELYHPGQYLLRLHQPGYQETGAVELELAWLAAMCRDAHLPVPRPVPALDGRLLIQATVPGIPGERNVSLLRWLKGRFLHTGVGPRHYRAQGRLMARLHDHAAHWQPPAGLTKRHWDWNGLFRDVEGADLPGDKVWALLPQRYEAPFEEVARQARQLFDAWGKGPDVYGLIHADLGVDANCLFWAGEARAIDFDDSGFGYWMYDLAVSLEHVREDASYPAFRDALLGGYAELRSLPDEQLRQLEFFLASFYVYLGLWAVAMIHLYPRHREELTERLERAAGHVKQYLAGD